MASLLKVRRAIPPLYPGMYPPTALMNELAAAGRRAIDALTQIRDCLERYETTELDIEKPRIISMLQTIEDCKKEFYLITKISYSMKEREDERIKRGKDELIELELAGAPERKIAEVRTAMRDAEIGSRQYTQIADATRLIGNIIDEGLEGMKESMKAMGVEV